MMESTNSKIGTSYAKPTLSRYKVHYYNPDAVSISARSGFEIITAYSEEGARKEFTRACPKPDIMSVERMEVSNG